MTNAEKLKQLRARAILEGKCYQCRCRPVRTGTRYCDDCIERAVRYKAKIAYVKCQTCGADTTKRKTLLCASCTRRNGLNYRTHYDARVAAGICPTCRVRPILVGRKRCVGCLDDMRDRQLARERAAGRMPREGRCAVCRAAGLPGTGHLSRTHDRYMERAKAWSLQERGSVHGGDR